MSRNNGFEEWGGYMDAKITKLEEQFSTASNPFRQSNIFAGISIYVNGLTNPSADELKRIMMVHGGIFHHYERSHTTYIIASNLPDVKVRNMNTSKIISAQWVVDCVREQRILDYTRYLLYTNQKTSQPSLSFIKRSKKEEKNETQVSASVENKQGEIINVSAEDGKIEHKFYPTLTVKTAPEPKPSTVATNSHARTAVDPKFLSEFYNNSRLHHIATLGAGFKQYVTELREKHGDALFPERLNLKETFEAQGLLLKSNETVGNFIMHIDMDCFFVSVGLRAHPELRGQPVAVTHSKGGSSASEVPVHPGADRQVEMELFAKRFERHLHNNDKVRNGFDAKMSLSEIASCSYEARTKGIHNGMFVGQAVKLCPELKTIPYDFEGYREVAFTLYNTIAQYTLNIEAVSCDEMFVDLSDVLAEVKVMPMDFVRAVREEVRQKTGCPCSAGVGANKLQARMATKRAKPDGQYHLEVTDVQAYMAVIPIEELPGVGSSTDYTLRQAGLITCGDLQKVSLAKIQMLVGKKFGETLHQFCRGIDNRPLAYEQVRKSVSAEVNYGIRFKHYSELETFLRQLCTEVHSRLNDIKRKTKCVTLKLMVRAKEAPVETSKFMGHGVCDHVTKAVSLADFTNDLEVITRTILTTMKALDLLPQELRGIGIQLSKLDDPNEGREKPKDNVIKNMFSKAMEKQKEKKSGSKQSEQQEEEKFARTSNKPQVNDIKTHDSPAKKKLRGHSANTTNAKESKKHTNVMGMLQNAAAKKMSTRNSTPTIPADIDPEVFAELPEDIRIEILHERARREKQPQISGLNESDLLPSTSRAAHEKRMQKEQMKIQNIAPPPPPQLDVDAEFLAALPTDLRAEIEMQLRQQQQMQSSNVAAAEKSYRSETPQPTVANKLQNKTYDETAISQDNIFTQKGCIKLLLAWVQSCDIPENYDVELISGHARELVRVKELDKLYDPLLYLCRLLNHQKGSAADCGWHLAYKMIINAVQSEMCEVYAGRKLFLGAHLKCDKCTV